MKIFCHLKPFSAVNLHQVEYLEHQAFGDLGFKSEMIRKICIANGDPMTQSVAAFHEDKHSLCGYAIWRIKPKTIEIVSLAVLKGHRRFGVGTQIVNQIKSVCGLRQSPRLTVRVSQDDLNAHLFFKNAGFEVDKSVDDEMNHHGQLGYYRFEYSPFRSPGLNLKNRCTHAGQK